MIRSIFLSLLIATITLTSPFNVAMADAADDIEVYTATSSTLEGLSEYLVEIGENGFVPFGAPYEATVKATGQKVWAIAVIQLTVGQVEYMLNEIEDPNGSLASVDVIGKTAAQFFEALTAAFDNGYIAMYVLRDDLDGTGPSWFTIAVKQK